MREPARISFVNKLTIDRPPAAVFAYLVDLENLPRWNYAISDTRKVTTGPVGVGTRYRQSRTIPARTHESLEVTELDTDRRLAVSGSLNALPAKISYELQPEGRATVLTNTIELRPSGLLSLLAPIATREIKSAVAANLQILKQILERA